MIEKGPTLSAKKLQKWKMYVFSWLKICPCTPRATFAMILKTGQTELCDINGQIIRVYALLPQLFEKLSWRTCLKLKGVGFSWDHFEHFGSWQYERNVRGSVGTILRIVETKCRVVQAWWSQKSQRQVVWRSVAMNEPCFVSCLHFTAALDAWCSFVHISLHTLQICAKIIIPIHPIVYRRIDPFKQLHLWWSRIPI